MTFRSSAPSWLIVNDPLPNRKSGQLIRWYFNQRKYGTPKATDALPGTEAKIRVLAERVERGELLFVEGDCESYEDRRFTDGRLFE